MGKKITPTDILKEYLVGKKVKHKNQYGRVVTLEVENVLHNHYSIQITPDTPENYWWGETKDCDETNIYFVDGSSIKVGFNLKLEIVD